jgi:hypothetical protein
MSNVKMDGVSYPTTTNPFGWSTDIQWSNGLAYMPPMPESIVPHVAVSIGENLATLLKIYLTPKKVIFREDSKTTIVIWMDDSKTVVRCSSEEKFVPEFGLAMATMKRLYGGRGKFIKELEKASYYQEKSEKPLKVATDKPIRIVTKLKIAK